MDASVPVGVIPSLSAVCWLSDRLGCRKSLFISQLTHYTIDHSPVDGWVSLLSKLLFLNVNESTFVLQGCFFTLEGSWSIYWNEKKWSDIPAIWTKVLRYYAVWKIWDGSVYVKTLSSSDLVVKSVRDVLRCVQKSVFDLRSDQRFCNYIVYILTKGTVPAAKLFGRTFVSSPHFCEVLLPLNVDEGHYIIWYSCLIFKCRCHLPSLCFVCCFTFSNWCDPPTSTSRVWDSN